MVEHLDQESLLELVRDLFGQPHEPALNNDLPISEPVDFNWELSAGGIIRLRLYVDRASVLAVKEEAATHREHWSREQRVLIHGTEAVKLAREIKRVIGQ